jgi:hypothetical protein
MTMLQKLKRLSQLELIKRHIFQLVRYASESCKVEEAQGSGSIYSPTNIMLLSSFYFDDRCQQGTVVPILHLVPSLLPSTTVRCFRRQLLYELPPIVYSIHCMRGLCDSGKEGWNHLISGFRCRRCKGVVPHQLPTC